MDTDELAASAGQDLYAVVAAVAITAGTVKWQKSTRCEAGDCVEVGLGGAGLVYLRDSKDADTVLSFSYPSWLDFLAGVRSGDISAPR